MHTSERRDETESVNNTSRNAHRCAANEWLGQRDLQCLSKRDLPCPRPEDFVLSSHWASVFDKPRGANLLHRKLYKITAPLNMVADLFQCLEGAVWVKDNQRARTPHRRTRFVHTNSPFLGSHPSRISHRSLAENSRCVGAA